MSLPDRIHGPNHDHELEQQVRAELRVARPLTDHPFVRVVVDRGVVSLTGSAASYAQKWAIVRAASHVVGVKGVRDYLVVHPATGDALDDHDIEQAARSALVWDARLPAGLRARVTDGVLRLQGTVDRHWQRDAAEEAVRNLLGLRDLVNEIRIATDPAPDPVPVTLAREVESALRRRFGGHTVRIAVTADGGTVTLRGLVPTCATLEDVLGAARAVPGVGRIVDQLLVA